MKKSWHIWYKIKKPFISRVTGDIIRKQFNIRMEQLGYTKVRTRSHQTAKATDNPVWSWENLDLKPYFDD
ncbi:hypothetical protein GQS40_01695|uniref:Uncharacterized protein n=1 Tax=Leuconostoc lactis TaxID=1246 RepID=A0A6L7A9F6_LEULA|nr:hypothetical protein [Leuconostoc lactis]